MSVFNRLFGKKDPQRQPLDPNQLLHTFEQFVNADTWSESQRIVEQNPVLLHPDADDILRQLAAAQPDQQSRQVVEEHCALLLRCQEVGIEQAFAEKTGGATSDGFAVPAQFEHDWDRANDAEERYLRSGDRSALDAAAAACERILRHPTFTASDDGFHLNVMNNAGNVYLRRYWASGCIADLDRALCLWQTAVQRTPAESPSMAKYLNNLGTGLRNRYSHNRHLDDLEDAILTLQRAVNLTLPDSPNLPAILNNLGTVFRDRFEHTNSPCDLVEAINAFTLAVKQTPNDSSELPSYLNNLGNSLRIRYARLGHPQDIVEAIQLYEKSIQLTLPDSPFMPQRLHNLSTGLRDLFASSGRLDDLAEAIRLSQLVVKSTSTSSPLLSMYLTSLGNSLCDKFARTGVSDDLNKAIDGYSAAVHHQIHDTVNQPTYLTNLGNGLLMRFQQTGQLPDLERAIEAFQNAVAVAPTNSPNHHGYLNNIGNGLYARYLHSKKPADLEDSIHHYEQAIKLLSADSADMPIYLGNLGVGFRHRYDHTGQLAALADGYKCFHHACELGQSVAPKEALRSARNWGNWALERREWEEATEAYDYGRKAIDGLFTTQTSRAAKESWLREAQGLPANAAYALAQLGRLEEAVVALEAGRARLLAEALEQNRRDLEQLEPLGHKAVLDRYRAASQRVTALQQQAGQPAAQSLRDSSQSLNQPVTQFDYSAWRQQLEQARAELDAAIAAIRQVAGYEDFFLPPTFERIQQAATPDAPLVYLVTTPAGSVALVVRAQLSQKPGFSEKPGFSTVSPVSAVWLDGLTEAGLRAAVYGPADDPALGGYLGAYARWLRNPGDDVARQSWFDTLDQTTRWLWDDLMGPVIAALRTTSSPSPQPSPQGEGAGEGVTLIPTGLLALLPLHAAWTENGDTASGRRYALDVLSINYAASARALSDARGLAASVAVDGILAVDNPDGSLVFSHQEVAAVRSYFPAAQSTVLPGRAATRQAVLDGLPRHSIFHFSTHGRAGWSEPLESSLLLAGGAHLTLRDLLDQRLAGARLAVLSACETGVPGTKLVDEVVSLPSGFAQAGVAGVVASLWAVNDRSTALLMERFYRHWRVDGLQPAEALRRAQIWLRDTTNQEMIAYYKQSILPLLTERMPAAVATYLVDSLFPLDDDARHFTHPIHWAAFTMTGV